MNPSHNNIPENLQPRRAIATAGASTRQTGDNSRQPAPRQALDPQPRVRAEAASHAFYRAEAASHVLYRAEAASHMFFRS